MTSIPRRLIERLVTRDDYFHIPHRAESDPTDPCRSYYYDLRARIHYPGSLENGLPVVVVGNRSFVSPIGAVQFGLAHLQHYWDTADERYLRRAVDIAANVIDMAEESLGLVWRYPIYVRGHNDWMSSMMQGQAASLLLRVGALTGSDSLLDKGRAALTPLDYDIDCGGVRTMLNGHTWFEEYAIQPPAFTLNGFIVTLLGVRDAAVVLEDNRYRRLYEDCVESLISNLRLFDSEGWSLYDLSTRRVGPISLRNMASPFYHRFHLELLKVMEELAGEPAFMRQRQRWTIGLHRGSTLCRAICGKTLYRLLTPTRCPRS